MRIYYLDTSAWIKRYVNELGSAAVARLIEGAEVLAGSVICVVEARAGLARRNRHSSSANILTAALAQLDEDWALFHGIRVSDAVIERARGLAVQFALRGADAIHLASVALAHEKLLPNSPEVIVVASDRELLAAASQLGFDVWNPEEEPQAV